MCVKHFTFLWLFWLLSFVLSPWKLLNLMKSDHSIPESEISYYRARRDHIVGSWCTYLNYFWKSGGKHSQQHPLLTNSESTLNYLQLFQRINLEFFMQSKLTWIFKNVYIFNTVWILIMHESKPNWLQTSFKYS